MNYGGKVCKILNNVLQKVKNLLLTMFTILPEPSGVARGGARGAMAPPNFW